jgi:hypothetical protein
MGGMMINEDLSEKAKRGWWASVVFMLLIVALVIFLSYVKIVEENRDILIGIIGMLTGSISSMLAIASGRDPSEMDELKSKLAAANADRQALIARLRDAQIQMQLLREQIFELQASVINKLSALTGDVPIKSKDKSQVELPSVVSDWLPEAKNEDSNEQTED